MTHPFKSGWRLSTACAVGVLLTISSTAFAQADPPTDAPAEVEETTTPPGSDEVPKAAEPKPVEGTPAASARIKPKDDPRELTVSAVGVEILPGSAYPDPTTRGIPGGSLWLTMHGLQWPYMPKIAGGPSMRLGFSGSGWVDFSYAHSESGQQATDPGTIRWETQARFVLRATPTYSTEKGWFAQGQGELVLNGSQPAVAANQFATDDLYIRGGKWNLFDVTAGRFQGWEVYHVGLALDLNTFERLGPKVALAPPSEAQIYSLSHYWDRPTGPGNLAFHFYGPKPVEFLRAEVLAQEGNVSGNVGLGVRAVGIVDWGMALPSGNRISVKVKGGGEYGKDKRIEQAEELQREKLIKQGWATSLQFVFEPYVEVGGGIAQGLVDHYAAGSGELDPETSHTTTTFGGFLNVQPINRLIVGFGYHQTERVYLNCTEPAAPNADCSENPTSTGRADTYKLTQFFGAVQYNILSSLYTKLVLAHGKADYNKYSTPGVPPYSHETGSLMGMPFDVDARIRFFLLF
jgi:hypothetical protein